MLTPSPELTPHPGYQRPPGVRGLGTHILAHLQAEEGSPLDTAKPSKYDAEIELKQNLKEVVTDLRFTDLVIPHPTQEPRRVEQFRFLPVIGKSILFDSLQRPGYVRNLPKDVRCTYDFGEPYMDAYFGIGLMRENWLIALSSAGVDQSGNIKVVQLQDVTGINSHQNSQSKREHHKSGLYDGFLWRDTLACAWIATALRQNIGDKLIIQSGENNHWSASLDKDRLEHSYDKVAERLGFMRMPDKNWSVELKMPAYTWPNSLDATL